MTTHSTLVGGTIALIILGLSFLAHGGQAPRTSGFALSSTTFEDGGIMPVRTTFNGGAKTPWCQGDNLSPQLSWTNAPADTKSYVMTMVTAEPEDVNMVIYGIPATTSSFAEGELSRPSDKYVPGKNRFGGGTWRGPCNPRLAANHYIIKIIATDLGATELPAGLTWDELTPHLKGHTRETAVIVGRALRHQ